MTLAQVVLFDGFDPLDAVAPYEVLAASRLVADPGVAVEFVSAEGAREVPSGLDALSLRAAARLEPHRADLVIVPGALGTLPEAVLPRPEVAKPEVAPRGGGQAGAEGEPADGSIPAILARTLGTALPGLLKEALDRPGLTVATVCGGSMVLAMAGLIPGRPATTHHMGLGLLAASGAQAVDARVVDDGDLVTGGTVTSGLDVGLYLLERELGARVAHGVEKLIAHERRGIVWRRDPLPVATSRGGA